MSIKIINFEKYPSLYPAVLIPLIIVLLCLSGCGEPTVPVSGKVIFDGQPAENIAVLFQPKADGSTKQRQAAYGLTNKNGEYSLKLLQTKQSGVLPGEYAVILSWKNPSQKEVNIAETEAKLPDLCPYKIPPRATTGEIEFTVPSGGTGKADFEFDSSKENMKASGI